MPCVRERLRKVEVLRIITEKKLRIRLQKTDAERLFASEMATTQPVEQPARRTEIGIPLSVLIPAPVKATMRFDLRIISAKRSLSFMLGLLSDVVLSVFIIAFGMAAGYYSAFSLGLTSDTLVNCRVFCGFRYSISRHPRPVSAVRHSFSLHQPTSPSDAQCPLLIGRYIITNPSSSTQTTFSSIFKIQLSDCSP